MYSVPKKISRGVQRIYLRRYRNLIFNFLISFVKKGERLGINAPSKYMLFLWIKQKGIT